MKEKVASQDQPQEEVAVQEPTPAQPIKIEPGVVLPVADELTKYLAREVTDARATIVHVNRLLDQALEDAKDKFFEHIHELYPGTEDFNLHYDAEEHTVTVERSHEGHSSLRDLLRGLVD